MLKVSVENVRYTDYYPGDPCEPDEGCIPFYFWFVYEATVLDVL